MKKKNKKIKKLKSIEKLIEFSRIKFEYSWSRLGIVSISVFTVILICNYQSK